LTLSPSENPLFLATAIEAVIKAGRVQTEHARGGFHVGKKGLIDLVTEVDVTVEAGFRSLIARRFPEHAVLGEEMGMSADDSRARYRWLFDPIDGTTNYAHGLPIYCASAALELDGRIQVAAVYDPNRQELFTAERGKGAFLNGAPLKVSQASEMVDALLVTGFPYDVQTRTDDIVGLFGRFLGRARAVRRLGSAALDLCYIAAGRMDGFWEQDLKPWDVAAGMLLVEEAGGRVTGFDGAAFSPYGANIVASNGQLHLQMLDVIGSESSG
jgi:myo-inositol-1(or 4)-monophosphatase